MKTNCRPTLFRPEMVRAILGNYKSMTRRIIKLIDFRPDTDHHEGDWWYFRDKSGIWHNVSKVDLINKYCPYGKPGDTLWVKETCKASELEDGTDGVLYLADSIFIEIQDTDEASEKWIDLYNYHKKKGATVPSIFMPRWASRILLEITNIRIEQLNSISREDAICEGIANGAYAICPTDNFKKLWISINGAESWESNPYVWVIEFKVLEKSGKNL